MAYTQTDRAPGASDLTAKNRVWEFFANPNRNHPTNRRQPLQPQRKTRPTPTKTASGIPLWPSRDPIQELGGLNLYGFVGNRGVNRWDILGLCEVGKKRNCKVVAYSFESEGTHRLENEVQEMIDRYSDGTTYLAILQAAATGDIAGVIQAMMDANVVGDIANAWQLINVFNSRNADELSGREIFLYATIEYEQCECLIVTYWSEKTAEKKKGPYRGMPNDRMRQTYLQELDQEIRRECSE